jgi:hypothetical protein
MTLVFRKESIMGNDRVTVDTDTAQESTKELEALVTALKGRVEAVQDRVATVGFDSNFRSLRDAADQLAPLVRVMSDQDEAVQDYINGVREYIEDVNEVDNVHFDL